MRLAPNVFNLAGREAYKEYKEKHSGKKYSKASVIKNRDKYREIVDALGEAASELMLGYPGGLFLPKMGYFFIWMLPRKMQTFMPKKGGSRSYFNLKTNNQIFSPVFIPNRNTWMSVYSMDKKFAHTVRQGIKTKIDQGGKFRTFHYDLKRYLS